MTERKLKIRVVHNPGDTLPETMLVDDDGNKIVFEGANVQFQTLCELGRGVAHIVVMIQEIPVECLGQPEFHEHKELVSA